MKSSLVSEQLSSREAGVTPKGEVRNGLLVGCQGAFVTEDCSDGSILREFQRDAEQSKQWRAVRERCAGQGFAGGWRSLGFTLMMINEGLL